MPVTVRGGGASSSGASDAGSVVSVPPPPKNPPPGWVSPVSPGSSGGGPPPPPPGAPPASMAVDTTIGSSMWPDVVPNRDITGGWKLPKQASPCYLVLTKGDPEAATLSESETDWFADFVRRDWSRNPRGAPYERPDFRQTLPDKWFPTGNAKTLLIYYMPWRQHHHDPQVGNYMTWSLHQSVRNAALVSANDVVRAEPTGASPLLPVPTQELRLVKRGLDIYFAELQKVGVTVEAPFVDPDYLWVGYWDDDAIEASLGQKVATMVVVNAYGVKGKKVASQAAYYLWSQVRNSVLYPANGAAGGAPPAGRQWLQAFNRVNVLEKDPEVQWGAGWEELRSPAQFASWYSGVSDWHSASIAQLQMGIGGVAHMQQRLLQMQVQLSQAEQAPAPFASLGTRTPVGQRVNNQHRCQDQAGTTGR